MLRQKRQELERKIAEHRHIEREAIERCEAECLENRFQAELDVREDRIRRNHAVQMRQVRHQTAEAVARINAQRDCFKAECSTVELEHRNWCEEDLLKSQAKICEQESEITMELQDSKAGLRLMRKQLEERKRQREFEKEMEDLEREEALIDDMASVFQQAFDKEILDLMRQLNAGGTASTASAEELLEVKRQYTVISEQIAHLRQAMPNLDLTHAIDFLEAIKGIIE